MALESILHNVSIPGFEQKLKSSSCDIPRSPEYRGQVQAILKDLSLDDLEGMMMENPNLKGYIQGYVAEMNLRRLLLQTPEVVSVTKIPDSRDQTGDFSVVFRDETLIIEAKSLRSYTVQSDFLNQSWEGSVQVCRSHGSKTSDDFPTIINHNEFDILAICCIAATEDWSFYFLEKLYYPDTISTPGHFPNRFKINPLTTPGLTNNVHKVLNMAYERKKRKEPRLIPVQLSPQQLSLLDLDE
jgi:hypothetical protein